MFGPLAYPFWLLNSFRKLPFFSYLAYDFVPLSKMMGSSVKIFIALGRFVVFTWLARVGAATIPTMFL